MLQNRSSSAEFAHANAEAGLSGHWLDSNGNSMEWLSKKKEVLISQKEGGTWNNFVKILINWEEFAAKTETNVVSD